MQQPIRTWTITGEVPLVVSVYAPTATVRVGDAAEIPISSKQLSELTGRFNDIEDYFTAEDPETL